MTPYWAITALVWAGMAVYMAPGAWSAVRGRDVRRGDPMRLACFSTALVIVGFNVRWLVAPDNVAAWKALSVLCAGVGVYILILARTYGRGPRI